MRFAKLGASTVRLTRAAKRLGRFDIVHANDLDTLPAAYMATRGTGSRLVYDSHEIYADQETDPPRLFRQAALAVERATARRADAVVTVSEPIARELERTLSLKRPAIAWLNCPERIGVTFEPGRPELLGLALAGLASDRPRLRELRVRARALAVDRLNAETQRDQLALAWGL